MLLRIPVNHLVEMCELFLRSFGNFYRDDVIKKKMMAILSTRTFRVFPKEIQTKKQAAIIFESINC